MATLQRFQARVIAETNVNVAITGVGVIIDGETLDDLDQVVLNGQTTPADNGYWQAHTGSAWTRVAEFDTAGEMLKGTEFYITEGNSDNAGSTWTFDTEAPLTVGTTALSFKRESYGPGAAPTGVGLARDTATNQWALENQFTPTGYYTRVQLDTYGRVQDGVVSDTETTFIEGLRVIYDSAAAITIEAGAAHIPGEGDVITLESDTSLSGLALTANTWYYVYEYETGGTGAIEVVTQAPETVNYLGSARIKGPDGGPDDTRRHIRSIRCSGTANIMRSFYADFSSWVWWQEDTTATPYRVLNAGTVGNTWTAVSCAAVVPPTSRRVFLRVSVPGGQIVSLGNSGTTSITEVNNAMTGVYLPFTLNSSQQFYYKHAGGAPGTGTNIDVIGFYEPV